jgi:parallel beta-helix repeat protein
MGDWDAINIMNSDGVQNLVEYVQIENAYRGLHFHFSNVIVNGSVLKNNYRAIQFQESAVEMRDNYIFNNKSGIKARDSEIVFRDNHIFNNINGVNFFRASLTAENNAVVNNLIEGMRIREGMTSVQENLFDCNRFGLKINDSYFGKFDGNVMSNNYETGISLRGSDNVELGGNFIQDSGFNGINILASGAVIKRNHISQNGERGIGIRSFTGTITGNSIIKNGLYAIENESTSDISAPLNWFGEGNAAAVIYDREDESGRGRINYSLLEQAPATYTWPLKTVMSDITWHDNINLQNSVEVLDGATLEISPGARVVLSKDAGMRIFESKILAVGEDNKRITFTSLEKGGDNRWGEILLEHADGSIFSYCDFEYASWAVHSHFTDLKISNSRFSNNDGGMRFRSGPMEIAGSQFFKNRIGMRAFMANALIKGNEFFDNETGIFIREKGGGLTIRGNNFHSNSSYNIRVGDFNVEDIDARENWWGGNDPEEMIFDGRREPGVGKVIYEPVLTEKINIKKDERRMTNDE